jgi:hypothetical protein
VFSRSVGQKAATFRQINRSESNRHRDALEFPDGKIVLLTSLCENQIATVLQLPAATAPANLEAAERNPKRSWVDQGCVRRTTVLFTDFVRQRETRN